MTPNHQPNCFLFPLNLHLGPWLIYPHSTFLHEFCDFVAGFFPLACLFGAPLLWHWLFDTCAVSECHCIGMMDHVWSCIHLCSISVNLNSFKRNWSKMQKFEKTFAPFHSKELFWLHGEVWKLIKATQQPLMDEISKLQIEIQIFSGIKT